MNDNEKLKKNTILKVENLAMKYGNKTVLENIDFDVTKGEFLSILGPSGCGKTTILRILIGILAPTSGKVIKDDVDITSFHPSKRKMGIVFQNYALFQNMTVLENVEYALKQDRTLKTQSKTIAYEMIERVNLSDLVYKKPHTLSGGQQQRVAIARTLALRPEIILFDEPMSALDVETRLTLRDEIKKIQKDFNITMIYITHDQEEAFSMSDRIMVMEDARIHQLDTPINILKNPANEYVASFVVENLQRKINSLKQYAEILL